VLQALATSLSWLEKSSGNPIPEGAILNAVNAAAIEIDVYALLGKSLQKEVKLKLVINSNGL
jgi:hypothetical protein